MVSIVSVQTYKRPDGKIQSEAVVTAADGDTITASDLGLNTVEFVQVTPAVAGHVPGAQEIANPGSYGNAITFHGYSLTANADSLVAAGSVDWMITAIGE